MSWKVKARIRLRSITSVTLHGKPLKPNHKTVLMEFADGVNDNGIGYRSTIQSVADVTELHFDTVKKLRRELIEVGLITVLKPAKGPGHSALIHIDPSVAPLRELSDADSKLLEELEARRKGGSIPPLSKNGSETLADKGSQEAKSERGVNSTPLVNELSTNVDKLSTDFVKGGQKQAKGGHTPPERGVETPPHPSSIKSSTRGGARERAQGAHALPAQHKQNPPHIPLHRRAIDVGLIREPDESHEQFEQRVTEAEKEKATEGAS